MAIVRAPGRVNLIGDHTDYQDGLCLPMAIDREVRLEFSSRRDRALASDRFVIAVAAELERLGCAASGVDATVTSTVPIGAGLSSSAAYTVAWVMVLAHASEFALAPRDVALVAQAAETAATGVPCGVMDQMACVFGSAGHALLLDCRTLGVSPIAVPDDAVITVVHSGLPRRLEDSAYSQRRAACEEAARRLGVATLRDATFEHVRDDPIARHVVSENARVEAVVDALQANDLATAGELMLASHASLRDDFRVSTPELDRIVELAVEQGALGARLTGAGFGGCVVALSTHELALPGSFTVRAADGACVLEE